MAEKIREGKVRCSFCQKTEDQVRKLIAGPDGAYICDECVGICSEIMEEEFGGYDKEDILGSEINLMKPEEDVYKRQLQDSCGGIRCTDGMCIKIPDSSGGSNVWHIALICMMSVSYTHQWLLFSLTRTVLY